MTVGWKEVNHLLPTLRITLPNRGNVCGVTLIELLVGLLIIGMIVTSVYTAFNCSRNSWQVGETMVQRYQNVRAALDMMSREIACALINDSNGNYRMDFFGADSSSPPPGWRTDSVGDELYFIARLEGATADLCEVGYYVTDEDGDGTADVLRRFYVTDNASPANYEYEFDSPTGNSAGAELALNVTGLDFEYFNGSNWETDHEWDSRRNGFNGASSDGAEKGTLPRAVMIRIAVQDSKKLQAAQAFYTIVYVNNQE